MSKFRVHLYAVVRVTLEGVVATGPENAAEAAQRSMNLDGLLQNACCADTFPKITAVEFTGDVMDTEVEDADL